MRRFFRATALLGAAVLALLATPHRGFAAAPLQIHAIFPLTGAGAFLGKEESSALTILAPLVNGQGGIGGRFVEFVVHDDASNPQTAVQILNGLLDDHVPVVLGASLVADCDAMAPLVKMKMVMYCMTPGFHPAKGSYAFSTGVSTSDQFVFWLDYLRRRRISKVAFIGTSDANGQDAQQGLEAALARPGNQDETLVMVQHFNPSDISVDAQMERIEASGAQVLFTYNNGPSFGTVLHGMHDVGLDIPVLESPAVLNFTLMRQFGEYAPSELLIFGVPSDAPAVVPNGPIKTAIGAYFDAAKVAGKVPDHTVASVWDPALIVLSALKRLGPDADAPRIWRYIEGLRRWPGVNGLYDFADGSNRGLSARQGVVVRFDRTRSVFSPVTRLGGAPLAQ